MRVVWNDRKAETNLRKHRLSFELAAEVFDDEFHVTDEDMFAIGERRFITMGLVRNIGLVVLVHTIENEHTQDELRGSYRREGPSGTSREHMKMADISYTPPKRAPITPEERKRLLKLSEEYKGEIDFSDIPPIPEEAFKNAVRGRFYRPVKEQVTLRLDANVLDWFKTNTPKGYQTDINRVLSEYVAEQEKKAG